MSFQADDQNYQSSLILRRMKAAHATLRDDF
jgi:hypothetical protein